MGRDRKSQLSLTPHVYDRRIEIVIPKQTVPDWVPKGETSRALHGPGFLVKDPGAFPWIDRPLKTTESADALWGFANRFKALVQRFILQPPLTEMVQHGDDGAAQFRQCVFNLRRHLGIGCTVNETVFLKFP